MHRIPNPFPTRRSSDLRSATLTLSKLPSRLCVSAPLWQNTTVKFPRFPFADPRSKVNPPDRATKIPVQLGTQEGRKGHLQTNLPQENANGAKRNSSFSC